MLNDFVCLLVLIMKKEVLKSSTVTEGLSTSSFNSWRRKWQPTPVFFLENPMDRDAWWATVHGAAKSWTRLSDFTLWLKRRQMSQRRGGTLQGAAGRRGQGGRPPLSRQVTQN